MEPAPRPPLDFHVHVVGNGSSQSGCWLKLGPGRWPLAALMLRQLGIPARALHENLEEIYTSRLLQFIRASSISAAVILAQDMVYDETGKPLPDKGLFYVPNDYVLALCRQHPEFLPGVSIHPSRPDALEELDRCLAAGAALMKCLPNCQNIDCTDRRFIPFWEKMAASGLPLLAHTGGEHTLPIIRKDFSDPRRLKLPLECGVTVVAAHCATKSGLTDPEYFFAFREMVQRYPRLFGDNSAFNVPIRGRHTPECLKEPLAHRIIHGSDFPVPVYALWPWLRGSLSLADFRRCRSIENPIERDYQLKRAVGFTHQTFTRGWDLLRKCDAASRRSSAA